MKPLVRTYWYCPRCNDGVAHTPERLYCPHCLTDRPGHERCKAPGTLHGQLVFSCSFQKGHAGLHDFERANSVNHTTSADGIKPTSDQTSPGETSR